MITTKTGKWTHPFLRRLHVYYVGGGNSEQYQSLYGGVTPQAAAVHYHLACNTPTKCPRQQTIMVSLHKAILGRE